MFLVSTSEKGAVPGQVAEQYDPALISKRKKSCIFYRINLEKKNILQ
jgi:hypothetical protein